MAGRPRNPGGHPTAQEPQDPVRLRRHHLQTAKRHRAHVLPSQRLAAHRHPLRPKPQILHGSHRTSRHRHLVVIALLRQHRDQIPEFASNINSPGFLRLFSGKNIPLVVAVLLSLALSEASVADPDAIHVINSKAPAGDPCALSVEHQVRGAVRLMKIEAWQQSCIQARDAHKETGLKTSVKVKVEEEAH